jgi:glycosyltransferase involved in cell wall biosynthesis
MIDYVLEGLLQQSYSDFEVLVVLKPSGDGTERVLESFEEKLTLRTILQKEGYFTDALNLGLKSAEGDIIAFLDDDAIPQKDWLQNHLKMYDDSEIGGVAGNVISVDLKRGFISAKSKSSEIIPSTGDFMRSTGRILWSCPIKGLENHLVYISRAGTVTWDSSLSHQAWKHVTKSLLGMGANMSVSSEAIKDFSFPRSWILGLANEQYLGWHVWKKGYSLVFNPTAVVYHIIHEQRLSRERRDQKKQILSNIELNLLFYRLYGLEHDISAMYRITWLVFNLMFDLKKICKDHQLECFAHIKGIFLSEFIGVKWLVSRKVHGSYNPLSDFQKVLG